MGTQFIPEAESLGINDQGRIVGRSRSAGTDSWKELNDRHSAHRPTGWVFQSATAINNTVKNVGNGTLYGQPRAFLLVPRAPGNRNASHSPALKTYFHSLILGLVCSVAGWAQPAMTSTNVLVDIDGNGGADFWYAIDASGPFGRFPITWVVGSGIDVLSFSRFLRASADRVLFEKGEPVGGDREVFQGEDSIGIYYGFALIGYQAENYKFGAPGAWEYITRGSNPLFLNQTNVLLGVRLKVDEVFHYGWLRLSRPAADNHTLFEVSGYDWNPVPGASIGAGEPPEPPPLHSSVNGEGQLLLEWDAAYGEMQLEWANTLAEPVDWQPVPEAGPPPVQLPLAEEAQRFYRLRKP